MSRADPSTERVSVDKYGSSSLLDTTFVDPFSTSETDELLDLPVLPPPKLSESRATGRYSASTSSGSLIEDTEEVPTHLSQSDLVRALATPLALHGSGEKQFLSFERRGLWGQAAYNIGYSYFSGIAMGGTFGFLRGLRTSPNMHPRVLLNSVLNGSGKYGARVGNAMGVLALVYTGVERQLEDWEIDRLPGMTSRILGVDIFSSIMPKSDLLLPVCAAFVTGSLFTVPRAVTMRGLEKHHVSIAKRLSVVGLGGLLTVAGVGAMSTVGPIVFGNKSPFRFV